MRFAICFFILSLLISCSNKPQENMTKPQPASKPKSTLKPQPAPKPKPILKPQPAPTSTLKPKPVSKLEPILELEREDLNKEKENIDKMYRELISHVGEVSELMEKMQDYKLMDDSLLLSSIVGTQELMELMLSQIDIAKTRDEQQKTILIIAVEKEYTSIIPKILKSKPSIVNAADLYGRTALMYAAAKGNIDVVNLLLKHKADKTIKDANGDTAKEFANKGGHSKVKKLLSKN